MAVRTPVVVSVPHDSQPHYSSSSRSHFLVPSVPTQLTKWDDSELWTPINISVHMSYRVILFLRLANRTPSICSYKAASRRLSWWFEYPRSRLRRKIYKQNAKIEQAQLYHALAPVSSSRSVAIIVILPYILFRISRLYYQHASIYICNGLSLATQSVVLSLRGCSRVFLS